MHNELRTIYDDLHIRKLMKKADDFEQKLSPQAKLCVLGLGKAAYHHVEAVSELYHSVEYKMAVVPKDFPSKATEIIRGAHPELEDLSFQAGRKLTEILQQVSHDSTLLFCLSGGGSALAEIPATGLTEKFLITVNSYLLKSGIDIIEMNLLRMALSTFKNGGALCGFSGRSDIFLSILSDIPTTDWRSVASSPLIYRELDVNQIKDVAKRSLPDDCANEVIQFVDSKSYKNLQDLKRTTAQKFKVHPALVADGKRALDTVAGHLHDRNIKNLGVMSCSFAESIDIHIEYLKKMPTGPFAVISGGECPVRMTEKKCGKGGRNTHFTLALVEKIFFQNILQLSSEELATWWIASLATDGRDGNAACAGACFDGGMLPINNPRKFLENFDSYSFFQQMDSPHSPLILLEEYQSNLMDVRIICGNKTKSS